MGMNDYTRFKKTSTKHAH